jgi:hypothetical protein
LSKFFLQKIRFQSVTSDRHTLAANIIAAHDAAELAIASVCDQLDCLPRGETYLMLYFEPYKKATGKELSGREYFRTLNIARNNIKHQGIFPDGQQWSRVGENVFEYVNNWCSDALQESFLALDQSALLLDGEVRRLYDEARQSAEVKDYKTTFEKLALALSMVFEDNDALRGFEAGKANTEDAIRVVGFGIHGNDFLALQQFMPHVSRWGSDAKIPRWKQSEFGHPGNWRESAAEFCLRTFVDVAVKLQGANWIPGPLSRDILYEQQIEALKDGVEFWRDVPDGEAWVFGLPTGKTKRESKQMLKRGERLKVVVNLSAGSQGIDGGKVLTIAPFADSYEAWNVLAADVKVVCVPRTEAYVKKSFPWLEEMEWEPE